MRRRLIGRVCVYSGWPAAHNLCYLRSRWAIIRRDVPHYIVQTLAENLEYLVSNKVSLLESGHKDMTNSTLRRDHVLLFGCLSFNVAG